jgi:hypothetical protein
VRALLGLVVVLGVLVGIGAVVDAALTSTAERQASEQLTRELGAPAEVDLRGWPVSLRLLGGRVPEVGVSATGVPIEGSEARITRIDATVRDVRVRFADLSSGGPLPVDGGAGRFTALLDPASVATLAGLPGALTFGDGVATVDLGGIAVDVVAATADGQVVIRPLTDVPGLTAVPLPLGDLPGGARVEAVRVAPEGLVLEGSVTRLSR